MTTIPTIYRGRKTGEGVVVTANGQLLPSLNATAHSWDWGYYGGGTDALAKAIATHFAYNHGGFPIKNQGPLIRTWLARVSGDSWTLGSDFIAQMAPPPELPCDLCNQEPCVCDDFGKGLMPVRFSAPTEVVELPAPAPRGPRVLHFRQDPGDCPHCKTGVTGAQRIRLTTATLPIQYLPHSIEGDGTMAVTAWITASALAGPRDPGSRKEGRRIAVDRLKKTYDRIDKLPREERVFALKELNCLGYEKTSAILASSTRGVRVFWSLEDLKKHNRALRRTESEGSSAEQDRAYTTAFTAVDLIRKQQ